MAVLGLPGLSGGNSRWALRGTVWGAAQLPAAQELGPVFSLTEESVCLYGKCIMLSRRPSI